MTYSLNTLNSTPPPRSLAARLGHEVTLVLGCLALLLWVLAMCSYSTQDAAWSTSGMGQGVHNWVGRLGAWLADSSYFMFGFSVWWVLVAFAYAWLASLVRWMRGSHSPAAAAAVRSRPDPHAPQPPSPAMRRFWFWVGLALLLAASTALEWSRLYRFESLLPGHAGGVVGFLLVPAAMQWLGFTGSGLLGIICLVMAVALVFGFSWGQVAECLGARLETSLLSIRTLLEKVQDYAAGQRAARERATLLRERSDDAEPTPWDAPAPSAPAPADPAHDAPLAASPARPAQAAASAPAPATATATATASAPAAPRNTTAAPAPATARPAHPVAPAAAHAEESSTLLPQVALLDRAPPPQDSVEPETLELTSRLIEKKLQDFGVEVTVVAAMPGPVITRYEIEPATGVKGSQVVNLAKDLARSLSLVSIRVVETIPGKTTMALELPNARRQTIRLAEVLGSQVYRDAKSLLTVGLGKDIIGQPVVADLAKMPHCLVAGTTGSGKSVGINAMILSLLYKAEARDVRLMMIDPKMLEMSVYEGIPHLLCPVVTDMKQAANGLNWCVAEMERRYKLMSKVGVRNLAGFNARIDEAQARGEIIGNPLSLTPEQPEPLQRLPHIVVVIDELADLMMVVGKKIEELIARLAQKARAAGIHLILATQRPSVDVITGLIKANIPTRIAFQVSTKIDSRTILDQMGAEALLGMGDMLYMASGTGLPVRVHGAFVSDDEVHRVVSYLKTQGEPDYIEGVLDAATGDGDDAGASAGGEGGGEQDPMYDQAVEVVLKDRKASISYVQRKLRIGYNRSANLLEQMERAGLVSALTSSGQREVLVPARDD